MALRIVLASGNAGKAGEFDRLLHPVFQVRRLPASMSLPAETGDTFAANALLKAEAVFAALQGHASVLADDSGLEVAALRGEPGVRSARYAGDDATDRDNVAKLLREMTGRTDRRARFVCSLCLMIPGGAFVPNDEAPLIIEVQGYSEGRISEAPRGSLGFGYDPVFCPDGWPLTLAETDPADKDAVSHRGAAARALLEEVHGRLGLDADAGSGVGTDV